MPTFLETTVGFAAHLWENTLLTFSLQQLQTEVLEKHPKNLKASAALTLNLQTYRNMQIFSMYKNN